MTDFPANQIPVYYINLSSRTDRRQFMEEQFARLGIVAERIDAVTIADVSDARIGSSMMAPVEIACTMSHEKVWRLLGKSQPLALVLEDDVVLGDGLKSLLAPSVYAGIGAQLVKLETTYEPIRLGHAKRTVGRFAIRQLLATHMCTGAYVISAAMARHALADPRMWAMTIDNYLFSRNGPVIPSRGLLQVDPAPTIQLMYYRGNKPQQTAHSDIEGGRARQQAAGRWRSTLASISYTLRLVAHILPDADARRQKRRAVAFEADA